MAKTLQQIFTSGSDEINQNFTIESWHVSQSVDAFTGEEAYDITVSGSLTLTGSLFISGAAQSSGNNNILTYNSTTGLVTYATGNIGLSLTTASVSSNTITFTKGDGSTFPLTINTGSGGGGGIPGGSDQQIQYNSASTFDGDSGFTYVYTSQSLQQGNSTQARGLYSHAEGYQTTASGQYSHAEGYTTLASALVSHAEGLNTTASGDNSHAEGRNTVALGLASHAEGFGTVASGSYQHVQGQYNLSSSVQSAFIIGNGINASNRRNLLFTSASTFQISGSLFISGAAQSGGDNNILTYNTTTGLVTYTASAAIGGGGGGGTGYTYEIGQYVSGQGGVIFHRWLSTSSGGTPTAGTVQNYLVVSLEDVNEAIDWVNSALYNTSIPSATSSWNGQANTNAIITAGATDGAAYLCDNYTGGSKSDWYLPAMDELWKLYINRWEVNQGLISASPSTYDLIQQGTYWSSTQFDASFVYTLYAEKPEHQQTLKNDNWIARAIRKFSI